MAKCHTCNQDADANTRQDLCGTCFKADALFCASCAMWELGPVETEDDFFIELYKDPKKKSIRVQRQVSTTSEDSTSSLAEVPLACDVFLATMGDVCPLILEQLDADLGDPQPFTKAKPTKGSDEEQSAFGVRVASWEQERSDAVDADIHASLYGEPFADYACRVLDNFRERYPTCKFNRKAIQVLLVMHLSAQERIDDRWYQDKYTDSSEGSKSVRADALLVKRWQTRTLARTHLEHHLGEVETQLGTTVKDLVSRRAWLAALASDDFELYMKGLKSPTLFAIDLLADAGSPKAAQEALELCVILYHSLTTTRTKDELEAHWSQKVAVSDFAPYSALGLYSSKHYDALYDEDGELIDEVKDRLRALHAALADDTDAGRLPAHPRYADVNVSSNGRLDAVEKNYLRYLPVMDTPQSAAHLRSECEKVVRKRVTTMMKEVRDAYLKKRTFAKVYVAFTETAVEASSASTSRSIYLDAPGVARHTVTFTKSKDTVFINIPTALDTTATAEIQNFANALADPTVLSPHGFSIPVTVTYESGNTRRTTRKDNILDALRGHLSSDGGGPYLEYSRDTTVVSSTGVVQPYDVEAYVDQVIAAMRDDFFVDQAVGDYPANLLLTTTTFAPQGWFPLMLRQHWYSELFPACAFPDRRAPGLWALEQHYEAFKAGESQRPAHYLDWRNHKDLWLYDGFRIEPRRRPVFASLSTQPRIPEPNGNYGSYTLLLDRASTRSRSVHNFGDKHNPRRSMLLLLDDVLYVKIRKDGSKAVPEPIRHKAIDDIVERADLSAQTRLNDIPQQWRDTLAAKRKNYGVGDTLLECQVFGGVDVGQEFLGFIFHAGDADPVAAQTQLDTHYSGTALVRPVARKTTNENYMTVTDATVMNPKLRKQAKDHTST